MHAPVTSSRKEDHVAIVLSGDASFRTKTTGFEKLEFRHNALPEIDFVDVDPSAEFLGKPLAFPLLVSCMTGGYEGAERINGQLAEACREKGLAMGVGSQRPLLTDQRQMRSFSVVRDVAPSIPVLGNIGAAEVARLKDTTAVEGLIDVVEADALVVHLNALQELLQPEGTPAFRGVLDGIALLVERLPVPVIVKETGAGISGSVARALIDVGVRIIDVAGAGGTSWAAVELMRRERQSLPAAAVVLREWGLPTADSVREVVQLREACAELQVIASGGIGNGSDIAKSIALGADIAAAARPMLCELEQRGLPALCEMLDAWKEELRGVMFLTGSRTLEELRLQPLMAV